MFRLAIRAGDLLTDLVFGGVHHRAASAAGNGDVFRLRSNDLAGERLLVGVPDFVLFTVKRCRNVLSLGLWRRRDDVRRAAVGTFNLLADLVAAAVIARVADPAIDANVVVDEGVNLA